MPSSDLIGQVLNLLITLVFFEVYRIPRLRESDIVSKCFIDYSVSDP